MAAAAVMSASIKRRASAADTVWAATSWRAWTMSCARDESASTLAVAAVATSGASVVRILSFSSAATCRASALSSADVSFVISAISSSIWVRSAPAGTLSR